MSIARAVLLRASRSKWLADQFRKRKFAKRAVKRFMPGEDADSALRASQDIVARHYVGAVRDRFYAEGLKRLRGELLAYEER